MNRRGALALLIAAPLLLGATPDRRGDVTSCASGTQVTDAAADVVSVDGLAAELGTSAVWRVTFASPIEVPDRDGAALRIDVLVRDPRLPPATLGDERGMNRIVRWDDIGVGNPIDIVWLHGQGHTPFNPPAIRGRTIEIAVPGRILLGESENGTESVRRARWSLFVRNGDECDRVGGAPSFRLRQVPEEAPPPHPTAGTASDQPDPSGGWWPPVLIALALVVLVVGVTGAARRVSET